MDIRLAMLQMDGDRADPAGNADKAERFCREAADKGADIALFPEMYNVAYPVPEVFGDPEHAAWIEKYAEPVDGPFVTRFRNLAAELDMAIAPAWLERIEGGMRNSMALIDRRGNLVGTYSKFHTCKFQNLEYPLIQGDDFYVWDLETAKGNVKIGAMICYDREHPESARILMLKGAEIILVPNACGIDEVRINQLRTRGFENQLACAMCNYAAINQNGHSVITDYDGNIVSVAGMEETVLIGDVEMEGLRQRQRVGIWGNSFRRPKDYRLLTEEIVRPGYGAKTAKERAEEDLKPVGSEPFEKTHADE